MRNRRTPSDRTATRRLSRWRVAVGSALLLLAVAGVIWPQVWLNRQGEEGQRLLRSTHATGPASPGTGPAPNPGASTGTRTTEVTTERCNPTAPVSVLVINHLAVTAPVQQGVGDDVLNVSVGHEPSSPWPGEPGTSLLLAHNVGYFQRLNDLRPGDQLRFTRRCVTRLFTVTGKKITDPGDVLTAPRNGYGLTLITCWPPNALFWTTDRLVITTELTATITGVTRVPAPAPVTDAYRSALPPNWDTSPDAARQSVGLSTVTFTGHPDPTWVQSTLPLQAEHAAVLTYFAAESAVRTGNPTWWRAVTAPGTRMPATWPDTSSVQVRENVTGTTLRTVSFTSRRRTVTITFTEHTARVSAVN